ncbi:MAG TPA: DUF222 domain-containing protein [Methylomirabilota bacterium]|nr:DUF222 domain-containing protein [Methylomirabilota bacterium]
MLLAPTTGTDLDQLGDQIAELSAHLDAATARLLTLLREFGARGGWGNGFRSCADWLSWRVGLDPGAARERVRVARALGELPQLAAALARGELSYAKVRALTRVATPETEARLLAVGQAGTAAHVERIVRAWRRVDRQGEEAAARHARRSLQVYPDEDGMMVVRGRLEPEVGALLVRALEAGRETLYQRRRATATAGEAADPPTPGQQQADALALVAETALGQGLDPGPGSERYQVVVHVDAAVLTDPGQPGQSALEDGLHVSGETSRRLACDATRVVMRHGGDGQVLDVGRRTRTIPPALRRALQARDRGCRFPGCGVRHGQGHHLHHWANGGPTRLDNLTLLCRRHHRAIHEEGYRVERDPEGTLAFSTPTGRPIPAVPAPPAVPRDPTDALVTAHRACGLAIDGRTACPSWLGERLDLGWAIGVLHPAAQ